MALTAQTAGVSLVRAESGICRVQATKLDLCHAWAVILVVSQVQHWDRQQLHRLSIDLQPENGLSILLRAIVLLRSRS